MKVYEIITEASPKPGFSALLGTAAAPANGEDPGKFWSWVSERLKDRNVKKLIAARRQAKAELISGYVIKPLFIAFRIYDQVMDLYDHLSFAEELYTTGAISADEFKRQRAWYIGVWEAQVLAPTIARVLMVSRLVALAARVIVTMATATVGVVGAVPTGGAAAAGSVAAVIAEQAFFLWLQKFLQSKQGEEFLLKYLFEPLIFLGKTSDGIWDTLTGYYKKADEKKAVTPQVPNADKGPGADTGNFLTAPAAKTQLKAKMSDVDYARSNAPVVMDKDPKTGQMVTGISDPATGKFIPSSELK